MKLVQQKKLYFSEGKSDKVYEVDLCENQDLFVVNFRYGRRGAQLREGTKTVFPVAYDEAYKIFNALVDSKEKKGYSDTVLEEVSAASSKIPSSSVNTIREETILKYLQQALTHTYTRNWKISRIILRAGTLKMATASELIAQFLTATDEFQQHNAITVLTSFENTTYTQKIVEVFKQHAFKTIAGRAACAYILKYGNTLDQEVIHTEVSKYISEDQINSLPMQFINGTSVDASFLYYAYVFAHSNESLRHNIYQLLDKIDLKVNVFKSIRYIYRTTQITNDILFFALLSKRIAVSKPGYTSDYIYSNDSWVLAIDEKKKKNPSIAFSTKTKNYFNKASYKKVYELSTGNTEAYIQYATETLCALNEEEDKAKQEIEYAYNYDSYTGRYISEKRIFPKYHNYLALMYILYGNSSRVQHLKNKWYYVDEIQTDSPREEALSSVWDTKPDQVKSILANAKSTIAVDFSLRIIKDNPHFLDVIDDDLMAKLVGHYHPKVLDLILDILEKKYKIQQPEEAILLALLKSKNEKGIQLGLSWLKTYERNYFNNKHFIVALLLSNAVEVIAYLKSVFQNNVPYNHPIQITSLQPLFEAINIFDEDFLIAVNELIGDTEFGKLLSETPSYKISELSNSNLITNKLFALNLAKYNSVPAYELFKDSFEDYINSDKATLRKAGIALLAHFPDDFLVKNKQDIVGFLFSEFQEVREAIQPTIERLVHLDHAFKANLLHQLLQVLTEAETYEGVHQSCYDLLMKYFERDLSSLSKEHIMALIGSKYESAQNLGVPIFEKNISLSSLTMLELVQLAHSDVFLIRAKLHHFFRENKARVNYELEDALHIFNTDWQDVIAWSCTYFDEHIETKNWTIEMLLYACDHVNKEVQAFGMRMVTKHFSEDKGLPLLQKLQEHPTERMQFFVTNYLEGYAKDNHEIILTLENYFKTNLFRINSNRAAKTRIYAFLEQEALKNEEVALMTVRIISTILDTKTLRDKSSCIAILLAIAIQYPTIEVPLLIHNLSNEI
ncbi:hypothetical protein I2486_19225 [Cellulophaga sp. E16_2]|uniref:hypothetical protein n=1 Tax=Cellulophaga sp. E16_2 TaxID=2789297 RepID=UPI001A92F421|nr:hypothetical protein [Cellulophaga sp. E16_2]MBO0593536.1 hypothetical protein [Cellulophaga sp. E16_2]